MTYVLTTQDIWEESIPARTQAVETVRDWVNGYLNSPEPDTDVDCSIGQGNDYHTTTLDFDESSDGGFFLHFAAFEMGGGVTLDVSSEEFRTLREVLEFLNETGLLHLLN